VQEWCSADGSRKGFLDAAQAAGLNVMLEISLLNGGPTTPQGVRDCMRPYKTHPALYGWMVTDEPDVAGHPPAAVLAAYQAAKAEDPAHPIAVTITCEPAAKVNCKEYVNAADAVHVDWYPVNYGLPAADAVARAIRRARRIVPAAKRLNPIIQTFDWKQEFGPPRHNGGKTRPPTWQEVRDMGLAGLREAKNATIIWLYCYCDHKSPAKLPEYNKAVWDNLPAITTAWQAWTSAARSRRAP
jgi:hypothetical protein